MKKKFVCLCAALTLAVSLSACTAKEEEAPTQAATEPASEETTYSNPSDITLEIAREGEGEMVPASLYRGDGYFFYVTENFEKISSEPDTWSAKENDAVTFSIAHTDSSFDEEGAILIESGYTWINSELGSATDAKYTKTEDGIYHIGRTPFTEGDGTWLLSASYPEEAEEGFGAEIATMFDTVIFE